MRDWGQLFRVRLSTVNAWIQRNERGKPLEPRLGGGKPQNISMKIALRVHALLTPKVKIARSMGCVRHCGNVMG